MGEELPDLLNFGSSGLYVFYPSFQKGLKESVWNLCKTLLLYDSLVGKEDFGQIIATILFPLQFCQRK